MQTFKRSTKMLALCAALATAPAVPAAPRAAQHAAPHGVVSVKPVANLRADFMYGADVSMLEQMEQAGARFYDAAGVERDCLRILRDNGVNWVRLRLWHNPVYAEDQIDNGKVVALKGQARGGGNNDLAATIRLAKRVRAQGLKFALDIHYSDFWADPEKQFKPAAWRELHGAALQREVYRYTREQLAALDQAGVFPDMVQVGNELNGGFLWPDGKTWQQTPDEQIGGADAFAALLAEGVRAVRDSDPRAGTPRRAKIAIHLADGATNKLYRRVFDDLTGRGLDYDIIGLSFYPYWHGKHADFESNLADLARRYRKDIVLMETAYGYTLNVEGASIFGAAEQAKGGYPATVQGQTDHMRRVIAALAATPARRGVGVFYWEPDWFQLPGAGVESGQGNAWANQAMFDGRGRALPSLAVFKRVQGGARKQQDK